MRSNLSISLRISCALLSIFLAGGPALASPKPSFMGLGSLPGGGLAREAFDVSPDGNYVAGYGNVSGGSMGYRWSEQGGHSLIGDLPGGDVFSIAWDVSSNGTAVGYGTGSGSTQLAVRWNEQEGLVRLFSSNVYSNATGVSADGSVIVGFAGATTLTAFRWTAATGVVGIGDLPGGPTRSLAAAVSDNGQVIVGAGTTARGTEAFRWTSSAGMLSLGYLPAGGEEESYANAVSADGSVVVGGNRGNDSPFQAFRWDASTGIEPLGQGFNEAYGISGDGSVIVGSGNYGTGAEAYIWDETNGARLLSDVLTVDYGLDLSGWRLQTASSISADGTVVVGNGLNPAGAQEAWRAVIPEPSTLFLLITIPCLRKRVRMAKTHV